MQGRAWRLVVPLCFLSNDRHSVEYDPKVYTRVLSNGERLRLSYFVGQNDILSYISQIAAPEGFSAHSANLAHTIPRLADSLRRLTRFHHRLYQSNRGNYAIDVMNGQQTWLSQQGFLKVAIFATQAGTFTYIRWNQGSILCQGDSLLAQKPEKLAVASFWAWVRKTMLSDITLRKPWNYARKHLTLVLVNVMIFM